MEEATLKIPVSFTLILALAGWSTGGTITYGSGLRGIRRHHVSVASSFMHFHGPVEGPEFEVKVPYSVSHGEYNHLLHGQDHESSVDYVSHPRYHFSYGVEDHYSGDFHSQKETRDGSSVSGEYSVQEPGGGVRVVRYRADKDGFHAVVHTSGKNDHSGGVYGGQGQVWPRGQESEFPEEQVLQEYPASYSLEDDSY